MKEAGVPGDGGEAGGDYPLQDLGDSLEKDNNPEGSGRVVGLLTRFVEDNPVRFLQGGGVVAKPQEGSQEGHQNARGDAVNRFPNRIGDTLRSSGRGGRTLEDGQGDILFGEFRTVTGGEEDRREGSAGAGWQKVVEEGLVHFLGRRSIWKIGEPWGRRASCYLFHSPDRAGGS